MLKMLKSGQGMQWRINKKNLIYFWWALVVGGLTGFVGVGFQLAVAWLTQARVDFTHFCNNHAIPGWIIAAVSSAIMLLIAAYVVQRFAPEAAGSGVQEIEGALMDKRPMRWKRILPVKFVSGLFALSSSLVVGREGPTIQMGGSIGKMIADMTKMSREKTKILLSAGAGAGLATAFNAPLAGVLFTIEELREGVESNFFTVKMVTIACIASNIVLRTILGQGADIPMHMYNEPELISLIFFFILGILVGFAGLFFNIALIQSVNFFAWLRTKISYVYITLFVGACIGLLSWFAPQLTGGGYKIIERSIHIQPAFLVLMGFFFARFATTLSSYPMRVAGGIFAPMLALGTLFGTGFGEIATTLFPHVQMQVGMFAVVSMGAFFAASVRAPITGIVLVVEMTQNYLLIIPIMVACLASTTVVSQAGNLPIYEQLLARTLKRARSDSIQMIADRE